VTNLHHGGTEKTLKRGGKEGAEGIEATEGDHSSVFHILEAILLKEETLKAPRARAFEPGFARQSHTDGYGASHISRASNVALSRSTSNTVSHGAPSLMRDMRCPGFAFLP
jgi:hypothetical protein